MLDGWSDKALFTPGPLTTSRTVKQAMLRDLGSRDFEFIGVIKDIRRRLLALAGATEGCYEAIPMQGSGTYSVEAVLSSTIPRDGKVLILINGAYGHRMVKICKIHDIDYVPVECPEDAVPDVGDLAARLQADAAITHVAVVHCETTTGIINPIEAIGRVVKAAGRVYFVDAMSSFGAVPVDVPACGIDFLVSSSNKCIEGVPGFGFVIARRDALLATAGYARTLSLDILDQWKGLESNGQFRFTPPTHALLAFHRALIELEAEGGVAGRGTRYQALYDRMVAGMRGLGFREYLRPELQGCIITSFRYPDDPKFDFEEFYRRLNDRGYVIYPGKVSKADCFRIGTIGRLGMGDVEALLAAIGETMREMKVHI